MKGTLRWFFGLLVTKAGERAADRLVETAEQRIAGERRDPPARPLVYCGRHRDDLRVCGCGK